MKPLIEYKKPWTSFEDQLAKLKQRGLFISEEEKALDSLQRMGYYRLSGYFHSLKQRCEPCCLLDDSDNLMVQKGLKTHETVVKNQVTNFFKQGTQFQDAVHLYVFDKKLRLLALDGLERIEVGLRVDIAHQLGKRGAYSYLDPSCLARHFTQELDPKSNTTKFVDWLSHQARQVGRTAQKTTGW